MVGGQHVRDVTIFFTLYLLLSLGPFVVLNRDILSELGETVATNTVTFAIGGTALLAVVSGLFLASEGVDRYNQFLFAPTDFLSILVEASFIIAAISWWLVPELSMQLDTPLTVDTTLFVIILCQVPMVLFLSLMTAVGKV